MLSINRISNFFSKRQYLVLFLITVSLFIYLQFDSTFADPDSFYHAKLAEILAEKGAITEFPWLTATNLKYNFVDHHFLYHLILIPFVKLFSPLFGLKIATVTFASLLILTFFWFLRQLKVKGAFWYALFLLTVNPFIFRVNLAKAQALVLIFLFLIIYLLFTRRYLFLILVSCLYVWLYGGWPLLLVLAVIYGLVSSLFVYWKRGGFLLRLKKKKIYGQNLLLVVSILLGIAAGVFFSPYFPWNLDFYWQQSFKIAVLNYQYSIGVGGEWYPYQFSHLLLAAAPLWLLYFLAVFIFTTDFKKQSMNSWFFLILSFLFFMLTLKSRRYIEYFVPLAVCFSALSLADFFVLIKKNLPKIMPVRLVFLTPLLIFLVLAPVFYHDLTSIKHSFQNGFAFNTFAEPMQWLKENSEAGDIVFHSDWDEFPILFFHNSFDYYLVGLDPTFMYFYNPGLYQQWSEITTGQFNANLYEIIKRVFGAKYVFVNIQDNEAFDQNLASNFHFQEVFKNQEAKIYKLD
ncbi:MAG: hypothetical protein WC675_04330 [Patescibacteria group bacterium]|jgi:hypothetical protein